jgi:hypothetical protein
MFRHFCLGTNAIAKVADVFAGLAAAVVEFGVFAVFDID